MAFSVCLCSFSYMYSVVHLVYPVFLLWASVCWHKPRYTSLHLLAAQVTVPASRFTSELGFCFLVLAFSLRRGVEAWVWGVGGGGGGGAVGWR